MPINNDLPKHPPLVNLKTREEPKTKYINSLTAIGVKILNAPTIRTLEDYIGYFTSGTWEDKPVEYLTVNAREKAVDDLFDGYLLPTALETIKITFLIKGMDLSDVCHVIRHRTLGFSASGTGDRDMRHDDVLLKPSIIGSKYEERYKSIIEESKKLYAEMMDDPEIPVLDPRVIIPRCTSNYYYVTGDLKAIMAFVKQRKDEAIEPETMNIIALKLWIEICKLYPKLKSKIDFSEPDYFAISTSEGGRSSNFYIPEPKNDVYDYRKDWFMKDHMRREMRGGKEYINLRNTLLLELENISSK